MIKTYKYKLNPNNSQMKTFEEWINTCRLIYNISLEQKDYAYSSRRYNVSKYESYNQLPDLKNEFTFIKNVHSDVLQEVIDRLFKSYDKFYKGGGFPKYKKKRLYNSFTFKRGISIINNKIKLPKIGLVKFFNSREIVGVIKTATISKELKGWFISITFETPTINRYCDNQAVGIDVGIKHFLTFSDGTFIDSPYFLEPKLKELKRLQRRLSRQVKGSNSRNKTKHQISKLHLKISNSRKDFNQKQSTIICDKFSEVYIEDLKIQNMTKLNPTLSRRMLDNSFYSFRLMLEYKLKYQSKILIAVPPAYTSQRCNECGFTSKDNRLNQSEFICTSCGNIANADLNAAKNILALGKNLSTKVKPLG